MSSTASAPVGIRRSTAHAALILTVAVALAIAVNALVAAVAVALGAPVTFGPLTFPAYALFTAIGVAVGWFGWVLVSRRARDPRRTLATLVPVVLLLSFVPDVLLLVFRFIPETTTVGALALMVMHLAVAAIAVPAYGMALRAPVS